MSLPFKRTTCACQTCVACCKEQPASLIPGDFERIAEFLGYSHDALKAFLWASPGAIAMNSVTGRQYRIGTITPRLQSGRCVFLDEHDRCRIHPVAPAGCAYFDTHMSSAEGQRRGLWVVELQTDPEYQKLRSTLPFATSYKPRRA